MAAKDKVKKSSWRQAFASLAAKKYFYQLVVFAFSFAIYSASVFNDYNLDDELVTRNHKLTSQGIEGIATIFSSPYYSDDMGYAYGYRPIVLTSFAIEHQFFGDSAGVSHFINVILYAFLCVVVFVILKRLLPDSKYAPIVIALLFAAHPIHAEVVCSIKNRDEILALLFSFLSMWVVLRTYQNRWWSGLFIGVLLFVLALLSKVTVISMAVIIPLTLLIFTDLGFKRVVLLALALLIPALIVSEITLLLGIILLTVASVLFLGIIYLIKNPTRLVFLKKIKWDFLKLRSNKAKIKTEEAIAVKAPPVKAPSAVSWLRFGTYFIPVVGLGIVLSGVAFEIPALAFAGIILLTAGMYLCKGNAWYTNVVATFASGLLLIEFYDLDLNYISGAVNVLLLSLLLFDKQERRKFWGSLYAVFLIFFWSKFQEGVVDFLTQVTLVSLVYFKRLQKAGYIIVAMVFGAALVYFIWYLASSKFPFPQSMAFIAPLAACFFVLKIKNKDLKLFQTFILFFIATSFLAETNFKVLIDYQRKTTFAVILKSNAAFLKHKAAQTVHLWSGKSAQYLSETGKRGKEKVRDAYLETEKIGKSSREKVKQITYTGSKYKIDEILPNQQNRALDFVEAPVKLSDPLTVKLAAAFDVLLRYLKLVIVPYPQSYYYGFGAINLTTLTSPMVVISILLHVLVLLAALILLWHKKRLVFYGITFYLLMILPFANVWQLAGMMGDRYLFGASLGFCIVLGIALQAFPQRLYVANDEMAKRIFIISLALVVSVYSFGAVWRVTNWRNDLVLMRHDIVNVNESAQAHNLLAMHLMMHSDLETGAASKARLINEALIHFNRAVQIYPAFYNAAYYRAKTYAQIGLTDSAITAYKRVIEIDSTYSDAQMELGNLLQNAGKYEEALPYFRAVVSHRPADYAGYDKLSYTYFLLKDYYKAIEVNTLAANNLPHLADPSINIGRTYFAMQKIDSAIFYAQKGLAVDSNSPNAKQFLKEVNGK
jgi:tetratricopeptide (TPR) repeat protein